jgi:hypothetical protein
MPWMTVLGGGMMSTSMLFTSVEKHGLSQFAELLSLSLPAFYVDLRKDYGDRCLQIIVKLANIHLTLEKPRYNSGVWLVEEQLVRFLLVTIPYYF